MNEGQNQKLRQNNYNKNNKNRKYNLSFDSNSFNSHV
jgi:hypothetical protein